MSLFPLYIKPNRSVVQEADLFGSGGEEPLVNVSDNASLHAAKLKTGSESIFFHILATLHSPAYRTDNAGALRQDWPRIPLPKSKSALEASAKLGRRLAELLDPETPANGVTTGRLTPEMKTIAVLAGGTDLRITAGWGFAGQGGVTMPGKGRLSESAGACVSVHLNEHVRWDGIPQPVWDYTLGGYQVLKKWLSYREHTLLGRPLTADEALEFTHIARRIAALLLMSAELDASHAHCVEESSIGL